MAFRGPTIGASLAAPGEEAQHVDVSAFYGAHVAPRLGAEVPGWAVRVVHEITREALRSIQLDSSDEGQIAGVVFAVAQGVRSRAIAQLKQGDGPVSVSGLLKLAHAMSSTDPVQDDYLDPLSAHDLIRMAQDCYGGSDPDLEIKIRETLRTKKHLDGFNVVKNHVMLAAIYYKTGNHDLEMRTKEALIEYLEELCDSESILSATRAITRLRSPIQSALRIMATERGKFNAEIVLRRAALEQDLDPRTDFLNKYYLGYAMKQAGRYEEAVEALDAFLMDVEISEQEGVTGETIGLNSGFETWKFKARELLFESRQELGTLTAEVLEAELEYFEAALPRFTFSSREKLAIIHEMRGEFDEALSHLNDLLEMRERSLDERADAEIMRVRQMIREVEAKMDAAEEVARVQEADEA